MGGRDRAEMKREQMVDAIRKLIAERDDAVRLLAKVVTGGNPTGLDWQRINELIREHNR